MNIIVLVDTIFRLYTFVLLARVLISFVPIDPNSQFVIILVRVTEPVLGPCRELLNAILSALGVNVGMMRIDFSPIMAFLLIDWVIRPAVRFLLLSLL